MPRSHDAMDLDESQPSGQDAVVDSAARERELDEKYPNRPHNQHTTLPFHSLFMDLFNPLHVIQNEKAKRGPSVNNRARGPDRQGMSSSERKRAVVERYISRWRREVGDDLYPAFRLIMPDKDRDRAMYGLKEKILAKYLVKIMKIDKNSEDASNLLNWKSTTSSAAGDFPGRCYEVLQKRPFRVEAGGMTIGEVNDQLDRLSGATKEDLQLPIMADFYQRMNAEELMWLVRIILRAMKVGATEKTFFHIWHPDAESLFNISSSLRRVCWELYNPNVHLEGEDRGVSLMQCFQPQLAQFHVQDFSKLVGKMRPTEDDHEFWIEEKLDGERMQMHMVSDDTVPGGRRFKFWSRKAKEYTYLYGQDLYDKNGSLTRHIKDAFPDDVESIILDGEMITWDMEQDKICAFGTLKTAALAEQKNEYALTPRPLFKVFDILLLNDRPLTQYVLRDRRKALERSLRPVHRRIEIHGHTIGETQQDIESALRIIIEEASEGLVLKNPRSAYRLSDRNDDWMKVKPDYMDEYGENLDCVIIGGYFGSGRRGGGLSSFLCGLRSDNNSEKFISFFKIGGGMKANDYAHIKHLTEGKWHNYDVKNPPTGYIELAGAGSQRERPDQWIKPSESVVVEAKGASIAPSEDFAMGLTLRFPRFKRLRQDRDQMTALSVQSFLDMKANVEARQAEKKMQIDETRKRRKVELKKALKVVGYGGRDPNSIKLDVSAERSQVFQGLTFYIITDSPVPHKHSKFELENIVKSHGGRIVQSPTIKSDLDVTVHSIADRRTVKVASLQKSGHLILKSTWLFDSIAQAQSDFARDLPERVVMWEPTRHFYHASEEDRERGEHNVDKYGDAIYRDTSVDELRSLLSKMDRDNIRSVPEKGLSDVKERWAEQGDMKAWLFKGKTFYFDDPSTSNSTSKASVNGGDMDVGTAISANDNLSSPTSIFQARVLASFASACMATSLSDNSVTHIITQPNSDVSSIRKTISCRKRLPRIVDATWVQDCWREETLVDEEQYLSR